MSVRHKTVAIGVIAAFLPVMVLFFAISFRSEEALEELTKEVTVVAEDSVSQVALDLHKMVVAQHALLKKKLDGDLKVARAVLDATGTVSLSEETVRWKAINQETKAATEIELPKMYAGDNWLGMNRDSGRASPVVDDIKNLVGGTATVFQRMNPNGDMLRVSTNVLKKDNSRAIGTYIPAGSPVVKKVLSGETYRGRAFVVNAWYITAYEPIFGPSNEVLGMLYVGIEQETVDSIRKAFLSTPVGKTGYAFVLGGKGDQKGTYIISKDGARDGESILAGTDATGRAFVQEWVQKAVGGGSGQVFLDHYDWKNPGEDIAREKIAALTYFPEWDWVIGAGTYLDDYTQMRNQLQAVTDSFFWIAVVVGGIGLFVAGILAFLIGGRVSKPIRDMAYAMDELSQGEGDLTVRLDSSSKDEIGVASEAFNRFVEKVQDLMREVAQSADEVVSSAGVINNTSDDISGVAATMKGQTEMASEVTNDVTNSINSIATASEEVSSNVSQVAGATEEMSINLATIASSTDEMSQNISSVAVAIEEMSASIGEVSTSCVRTAEASQASSAKADTAKGQMANLADSAKKIGKVVELIEDIADQTSLLALNATIEAASAGEAGKGFAVVANEVKNLANQTSKATEEIAEQVQSMQSDTTAAVTVITEVSKVIDEVRALVDTIAAAVEEQSATASEIARNIAEGSRLANESSTRVQEVSVGVGEVASNSSEVSTVINDIADSIQKIASAADELKNAMNRTLEGSQQTAGGAETLKGGANALSQESNKLAQSISLFKF